MNFIAQIIDTALNVLLLVVFIHVIMSWLIGFGILNTRNRHVAFVWQELERILEPIYSRIPSVHAELWCDRPVASDTPVWDLCDQALASRFRRGLNPGTAARPSAAGGFHCIVDFRLA